MVSISREVPLDQLALPTDDVRDSRDEDGVRSLASSMGDPEVGQQQPITVYPNDQAEVPNDPTGQDLAELYQDDALLTIHDGVTRLRAAEMLGWSTLWAVIVPEPPENEVVARLEANTERIDMSDYEVFKALYDHYEETDATLEEVGEKVGVSASYMSNVFGLFEAPDWLRRPWATDGHPLDTSHAIAVKSFLSDNTVGEYAQAGGLDDKEAHERAVDDAKLMVQVQAEHDVSVSDFRQRCKRKKKETVDGLKDQRSQAEKQAEGQTATAERDHTPADVEEPDPCLVCGGDRRMDRKIALPVCNEDYGMLSEMRANGGTLIANGETPELSDGDPLEDTPPSQLVARGLQREYGLPIEEGKAFFEEVGQQIQQGQQ